MTPEEIAIAHGVYVDSMLEAFKQHLHSILLNVQSRVTEKLRLKMSVDEAGYIDAIPSNYRAIRLFNELYEKELVASGYRQLIEQFVGTFSQQYVFLQDVLDFLALQLKTSMIPATVEFTVRDVNVLAGFQVSAAGSLEDAVASAAATIKQRALFSIGGLPFSQLATMISDSAGIALSRALKVAESATVIYYRTATDLQFQKIEKGLPVDSTTYKYYGPLDLKTRPFCRGCLAKSPFTRTEIDELDNDQLPNVFLTGGGYNCRHVWMLWSIGNLQVAS